MLQISSTFREPPAAVAPGFTQSHLKPLTLKQVFQLKAAEKTAKDAFWAQHAAEAKPGKKPSAAYLKLQEAMIAATKARQVAGAAYAATL